MWPSFIRIPENYYYTEPVAGILIIVPLVGLAALLLIRLFWLIVNGDVSLFGNKVSSNTWLVPLVWVFHFGIYCHSNACSVDFYNSAIRYLLDISPALIVLSTMFVGYDVQVIEKKPHTLKLVSYMWILASLLTVISGFLIGFTGDKNNFLNQNPQLYYQLFEWFSR